MDRIVRPETAPPNAQVNRRDAEDARQVEATNRRVRLNARLGLTAATGKRSGRSEHRQRGAARWRCARTARVALRDAKDCASARLTHHECNDAFRAQRSGRTVLWPRRRAPLPRALCFT